MKKSEQTEIKEFNERMKASGLSDRVVPNNLFAPPQLKIRHRKDDGFMWGRGYFMYNRCSLGIGESLYIPEGKLLEYMF